MKFSIDTSSLIKPSSLLIIFCFCFSFFLMDLFRKWHFNQNNFVPNSVRKQIAIQANLKSVNDSEPVPYYPKPLSTDYKKGYIIRYFTKKINSKGYIMEISETGYNSIINGTAQFDVSMYQALKILWKISGELAISS